MSKGCVVFDLDGTLADTSKDLIFAANGALVAMGYTAQLDPTNDAAMAFRGGRAMLTLGLARVGVDDQELVERGFPKLIEVYSSNICNNTFLFPGVMDSIAVIRDAGHAVSICTNKPEAQAIDLIDKLGVSDAFDALVGADTLPVRKPDPAPYIKSVEDAGGDVARSILIGDTITDRDTARAAGVPSVLVTFGAEGDKVADLEPDVLLRSYTELPKIVNDLLGGTA